MTTLADAAEMMTPTQRRAALDRLVAEQVRQIEGLTRATQNQIYAEFMSRGAYMDSVAWADIYADIVSGAQVEAHIITLASTAEHTALAVGKAVYPAPVQSFSAWTVTADTYEARAAQIILRQKIVEGIPFNQAADQAARRAAGMSSRAIQEAQRQAGRDWRETDTGQQYPPSGWRKVPSGAACGWCIVVADRLYYDAGTVPAHDHDRCGFAPVIDGDGWYPGRLSAGRWDDIMKMPASPDAATLPPVPGST